MFPNPVVLDFSVVHHLGSGLERFGVSDVSSWWDSVIGEWLKGAEGALNTGSNAALNSGEKSTRASMARRTILM